MRDYDLASLKIANRIVDTGRTLDTDLFVESVIFLREAWMPFPRFMRRRYSLQRAVFSWRIKQLSTIKVSLVKVFEMSIRSAEKCRICSVCFIRNPGFYGLAGGIYRIDRAGNPATM